MGFAFFEGEIQPIADCNIGITSHALHYGTSAFAGLRAYWNERQKQLYLFRPLDHFNRLTNACSLLQIDVGYSASELLEIARRLLRHEGLREDCYLRAVAYKGSGSLGARLHDLPGAVFMFAQPFGRLHAQKAGLSVGVSSWQKVRSAAIPARAKICGTYVNNAFAKSEAAASGYDEPMMLCGDGSVAESSAANVFLLRRGTLITPDPASDILEGITRDCVLRIAREAGFPLDIRRVDRAELYDADEVFLCGIGMEIKPVLAIDGRSVGSGLPGPLTTRIAERYFRIVRNDERPPEPDARWCEAVLEPDPRSDLP